MKLFGVIHQEVIIRIRFLKSMTQFFGIVSQIIIIFMLKIKW